MPILQPEIQKALRAAGLQKSSGDSSEGFDDKLNSAGLTTEATLAAICQVMMNGESDSSKLKAAEMVLKAKGLLKETAVAPPSVTIVIQDPNNPAAVQQMNPILVPRVPQKDVIQ